MPALKKILVLHNLPTLPENHPDALSEHEIQDTSEEIANYLRAVGYEVTRLGIGNAPGALLAALNEVRPDAVFNLFEGTHDRGQTEAYAASVLEWLEIPFTGSPSEALALARKKPLAKQMLRGAGLPTPGFFVVDSPRVPMCTLDWPVMVKLATADASVGIDQGSVVTNQQQLEDRVAYLRKQYGGPVLVEEFISGREFNVAVIAVPDMQVLPLYEIVYTDTPPGHWPIMTYNAKWCDDSEDYAATPSRYPAEVPARLGTQLRSLAKRAFRLLGCRDYARVDFRVTPEGKPYILEVNPNPAMNPHAGLAVTLQVAGWTHARFAEALVQTALTRGRKATRRRRALNKVAAGGR